MKKMLQKLGLNEKQSLVYKYLIEYGTSPASEISKGVHIPKSTVNFIADSLWGKGMIKKSFQAKTGYYEADIAMLEKSISSEVSEKQNTLTELLPILKEKNKNTISKPKITFIDGVENCKNAYLEILKVEGEFLEFGAHEDLENAFGSLFMEEFIARRIKQNLFCDSVGTSGATEEALQQKDTQHLRNLKIFPGSGSISSSIAIYDNKVLILNLEQVYTGVLIENSDFAETMKTIFRICKS